MTIPASGTFRDIGDRFRFRCLGISNPGKLRREMEKEQIAGQPDSTGSQPVDELRVDLDATHEIAQRGNQILEVSKELTSSSKALLEQIEPIS